ncbi:MAG: hypothetical protein ACK4H7_02030 [Acidilobaceae archaeon]
MGSYEELKEHIIKESALLPEIQMGLGSIVDDSEDITCFTLKKIMGKREKGECTNMFKERGEML